VISRRAAIPCFRVLDGELLVYPVALSGSSFSRLPNTTSSLSGYGYGARWITFQVLAAPRAGWTALTARPNRLRHFGISHVATLAARRTGHSKSGASGLPSPATTVLESSHEHPADEPDQRGDPSSVELMVSLQQCRPRRGPHRTAGDDADELSISHPTRSTAAQTPSRRQLHGTMLRSHARCHPTKSASPLNTREPTLRCCVRRGPVGAGMFAVYAKEPTGQAGWDSW